LRAVEQFQAAISKDPAYALAYAGLADAYVLLPGYSAASPAESLPQAKAAALKALEIDPTLAEAHTSLAMTLYAYDLDFAGSADAFEKAIALNPNYATAHHWYSNTTLATLEQWDRMLQIAKRALELDPLSLIIHTDYAVAFINVRRYDEAIAELRKALQLDPRFAYAHLVLGQALQFAGDLEGAIVEYTVAAELVPDDSSIAAYLAQAHARAGQTEQARRALTHLTESAKKRYVSRYSFAILHLGLGDKATATEHLERAFDERAGTDLGWLHVEPLFDELRGYPPFDALVRKVIAWKQ
jgi:tetratricopeptide (TPR) repeat protein